MLVLLLCIIITNSIITNNIISNKILFIILVPKWRSDVTMQLDCFFMRFQKLWKKNERSIVRSISVRDNKYVACAGTGRTCINTHTGAVHRLVIWYRSITCIVSTITINLLRYWYKHAYLSSILFVAYYI